MRDNKDPQSDFSAPNDKILEINHLSKSFEVNGNSVKALEDIDFSVNKGEMICILGRSGCGKTTLLNIVAGFLPATAGTVLLMGKEVYRPGPDRCVVFQEDALFPWLTVEGNIGFGLHEHKDQKKRKIERFLSLVGLNEFRDYLPREISGGMKQRVALARVLILNPVVLLMDEPFAALDAQTREEMQNLLISLWSEFSHTILFVTHDVQEAIKMADRILLMDKDPGKLKDDIPIDLPRPRKMHKDRPIELSRILLTKLMK